MLRLSILCGVLFCVFVTVNSGDIGPGTWTVNYVNKCEEAKHKFKFDISQEKINRTHDGFNANFKLDEAFTKEFGYVDGGCKPFHVLSDDSFVNFVNKYAKNNVKCGLEMAGVDPPEFPIPEGDYKVKGYIFDYSELPKNAVYGEFCATCYMLEGSEQVGCIELQIEFREDEDE